MERDAVPEPEAKRLKLDEGTMQQSGAPTVPASEVIAIHLVDASRDKTACSAESEPFHPEFTHQVFGNDETITGYEGLTVDIFLDAKTFYSRVDVRYESSSPGADDVVLKLSAALEDGLLLSEQEFKNKLDDYPHDWLSIEDLGTVVGRSDWKAGELLVTFANLAQAGPKLRELHNRLELFLTFFIDGFACIDPDDPNWEIFTASYKTESSLRVIGFAVIYNLPLLEKRRKRVGHFFILPNYQGCGAGTKMLQCVYEIAAGHEAQDVTLEDPSDNMRSLRDKWDTKRLFQCDWLRKHASKVISEFVQNQQQKVEKPSGSNGKPPTQKTTKQGSHALALDAEYRRKIQADLRISQTQVILLWEGLLMIESKGDSKMMEAVWEFVFCRLANHWGLNSVSKKLIIESRNKDGPNDCFMMVKCRNIPPVHEALKKGVLLTPPEETGHEEKAEQVEKEVEKRMQELARIAIPYWEKNGG
ncbi:hypothetical protein BSKO_06476 [Bryopsis sp. KO-2023]|nr:hypothetical protein BSKO_06476 [Bryopsis sp. KO-2023]